jgi:ethylbenzene dioxygenase ferredoxin component
MTELVKLCAVSEVLTDEPKRIEIENFPPLAVYALDGEFYVTDDTCTHGMASLADGYLEGEEIQCPFHGGAFSIKTGEATEFPCSDPLKTYQVSVQDDDIYIQADLGR